MTNPISTPTAPLKFSRHTIDGSKQVEHRDEHFVFYEENKEDVDEFRNRELVFDNSMVQNQGCVLASSTQHDKYGCET